MLLLRIISLVNKSFCSISSRQQVFYRLWQTIGRKDFHTMAITSKRSLVSVTFAKKDFQRKAVSKNTSKQCTSKRSLMSVNFAK